MKLFVIIEEQGGHVLAALAREALIHACEKAGLDMDVIIHQKGTVLRVPAAKSPDDILLVVTNSDTSPDKDALSAKFGGIRIEIATIAAVLDNAQNVLSAITEKLNFATSSVNTAPQYDATLLSGKVKRL